MLVSDVKDLIKSLNIDGVQHYYCGILDNKQEYSLGFYKEDFGRKEVNFQGKSLSINVKQIQILVHWNNNFDDTERASMRIYKELEKLRDKIIDEKGITFNNYNIVGLELIDNEPLNYKQDPITNTGVFQQGIRIKVIYVEE